MEISLYQKFSDPLAAVKALGIMFARSGMFGCERPEQGEVLALICLSEGKSPVAITTNYDIVEGKLRKKALAALADFRSAGGKHKWLASGDNVATSDADRYAELELTDKEGLKVVYRYSMADAKAEGLVRDKSRWVKRPGNMLRARCISNGLGMLCPEIFAGEDDDANEPSEPKTLLRETAPAAVKAEPVKESHIDVTATVIPSPESKAEPQADVAATASTQTYSEADIATSPETGRLTPKAMGALESVIGEQNIPAAVKWLKAKGWIETTISEISVERAKRIMRKPSEFVGFITKA